MTQTKESTDPVIIVGPYTIQQLRTDQYWVRHASGEGGLFTEAQLLPYIKECFHKHF